MASLAKDGRRNMSSGVSALIGVAAGHVMIAVLLLFLLKRRA